MLFLFFDRGRQRMSNSESDKGCRAVFAYSVYQPPGRLRLSLATVLFVI